MIARGGRQVKGSVFRAAVFVTGPRLSGAVFLLDTIIDFQPMDRNVTRRRDTQADLVSLYTEHGHLDIVTDDDRLAYAPGKNEHIWYLSLFAPVRGACAAHVSQFEAGAHARNVPALLEWPVSPTYRHVSCFCG